MRTATYTLLLLAVVTSAIRIPPAEELDPVDQEWIHHLRHASDRDHATERRITEDDGHRRLPQTTPSQLEPSHDMPLTPDEHLITSLPMLHEIPATMQLFSGHLPAVADGHKKLFYWLVAPSDVKVRQDPNTPLIIWLNGGPGCSSLEGFFIEHGPLKFEVENGKWSIIPNPFSWHLAPAYVAYIDQPVGTGLSFTTKGDYATNDEQVNQDFYYFLTEFLLLHREMFLLESSGGGIRAPSNKRPIYLTGESHAGHYLPSMGDYILRHQDDPTNRVQVTLSGVAIGNGWFDPYHQYSAAEISYGLGLVNLSQKAHLDTKEKECQRQLELGNLTPAVCFSLLDDVVQQSHGLGAKTFTSRYDASKSERAGQEREFPKGHKVIESYIGGAPPPLEGKWNVRFQDVLEALHATESLAANQFYRGCTDPPYKALSHQDGLGVVPQIANLLNNNVRMLFYNGMADLICNHVGNERALMNVPWSKAEQWRMAPRYTWQLRENMPPAAYVQERDNLTFLKVPKSGHMLPMDQPELCLEMIRRFVYQISFQSVPQKLERGDVVERAC